MDILGEKSHFNHFWELKDLFGDHFLYSHDL